MDHRKREWRFLPGSHPKEEEGGKRKGQQDQSVVIKRTVHASSFINGAELVLNKRVYKRV